MGFHVAAQGSLRKPRDIEGDAGLERGFQHNPDLTYFFSLPKLDSLSEPPVGRRKDYVSPVCCLVLSCAVGAVVLPLVNVGSDGVL